MTAGDWTARLGAMVLGAGICLVVTGFGWQVAQGWIAIAAGAALLVVADSRRAGP